MIPFPCACGKSLAVQDALAGKMVKCPACGRTVTAPQPALAPTPSPGASHEALAPPAPPTISSPEARSRSSSADETVGADPGRSDLTSFLAPAQQAGELGRLGVFRVLKVLGRGGMGAVFLAEDPKLRRKVALKVMLPELARSDSSRQRFLREAQAAASLEHDYIVPILHVGEDGGVPYIVMPFLKGMPLSDYLVKDQPLPIAEVLKIGRETAEALAAAHDHGLVHRDIKPGNIWLESRSQESGVRSQESGVSGQQSHTGLMTGFRVKLLDFGLAHLAVVDEQQEHLTRTGALLGTPGYMSPEQVDGKELDGRSDLFSLGCVLYLLATGRPAHSGRTVSEKIVALATASPPPPHQLNAEVPIEMSRLIQELLAKKPEQRPASATAVARRLEAIERTLTPPPTSTAEIPIAVPVAPRGRNRLLVGLAVAILALGAGLLAMQQIRITTPKGTLVIEADDPNVEVVVKQNGAVIRDKMRDREIVLEVGDYTIELTEKKDGLKLSTNKFSITRNGKETVKVWLEKQKVAKGGGTAVLPADLHRKVVEWVLKQDRGAANVQLPTGEGLYWPRNAPLPKHISRVAHVAFYLPNPEALPPQVAAWLTALPVETIVDIRLNSASWNDDAFGLLAAQVQDVRNLRLWLESPSRVTNAGLQHLLKIVGLRGITLSSLKVDDDGVRELAKLPHLDRINLGVVPITDKTVDAFLRRGTYRSVALFYTQATEACLPTILKNPDLEELFLRGFPLRDDDLRKLTGLRKLQALEICGPHITNESVRLLEPLPVLSQLSLRECERIDDGVFDQLAKLKNVTLYLNGDAKITNAGLAKVKNLPKLTLLGLNENKSITADGVRKLRAELPKLKVEWDGDQKGTAAIPPDLHRRVAEWVLKQDRGAVTVEPQGLFTKASELPSADFKCRVVHFVLAGPDALPPKEAAWLKALPAETRVQIVLASPQWNDETLKGLVPLLRAFPNPDIGIHHPSNITDQGLKHLLDVDGLTGFSLSGLKVSDEGVRRLRQLTRLVSLSFNYIPVTDATVELLVSSGKCRYLVLLNTAASRASVPIVAKNADLEYLDWGPALLTDNDLQKLSALKKLQLLIISGPKISNEGLRHLQALPILNSLGLRECGSINDSAFDHLRDLKKLTVLHLDQVKITDAALEKVRTLPRLQVLNLVQTEVTAAGVAKLRAALPKLKVEWDGDAKKEPSKAEPVPAELYRKVVEWVLKQDRGTAIVQLPTGEGTYWQRNVALPQEISRVVELVFYLPNPEALPPQVSTWLTALRVETLVIIGLDSPGWNDDALGRLVSRVQGVRNLRVSLESPSTVTNAGLKHLLKTVGLRGITLGSLKVDDNGVRELAKLPHLDRILFGGVPITDKTVEALLHRGTHRAVSLYYTQATEACLPTIFKNADLEELGLRGIPLRDDDLRKFAGLRKLQFLRICGPHITNESVRLLEPLPVLSQLELRECERIDDGVFDHLGKLKDLTHLYLSGNGRIADAGLAKVKNLPKLALLVLESNKSITADAVRRLRAELPKLKVEWDGDLKDKGKGK